MDARDKMRKMKYDGNRGVKWDIVAGLIAPMM